MVKSMIVAIAVFLLVPRTTAQDDNAGLREEIRKLDMAHAAAIFKGDATKKQVQEIILKKYADIKFSNEDESDAFAVGLTYFIKIGKIIWDKPILKSKTKKIIKAIK